MSDDTDPTGIRFEVNLAGLNESLARAGKGPVTEEDLRRSGMVPMATPSAGDLEPYNPVTGQRFRHSGRTDALRLIADSFKFDPSDAYNNPEVPKHLAAVMLVEVTQMYLRQVEIVRALTVKVSSGLRGIAEQVDRFEPAASLDLSWYERLPHVIGYLRALEDQMRAHADLYDAR